MKRISRSTLKYVLYVVGVLVMAWLVFKVVDVASNQREDAAAQATRDHLADKNAKALDTANAKIAALSGQVEGLGETPVATPKSPPATQVQYVPIPGPRGPKGLPGNPGKPGAASTIPGPSGTDGKNGADGKDGTDGADGRGIASAQCGDDGRWTVTYTDGSSQDAGVCRVLVP